MPCPYHMEKMFKTGRFPLIRLHSVNLNLNIEKDVIARGCSINLISIWVEWGDISNDYGVKQ